MVKPKGLFSNAIWNILTVIITAIAGFIIVPIIIKSIGSENFGIYAIILMVGGFAQLQSMGLGEATLKYVAQYYSKKDIVGVNRVLGATLSVYIFSGIIISGLIVIFSPFIVSLFKISPENLTNAIKAMRIAGVAFTVSTFSGALQTIPEATQRYDLLNKYKLIMMILRFTTMYLIATLGGGIIGLTYLVLGSSCIDIFVFNFLAIYLIPGIRCYPNFEKSGIQEVFSYGVYSFINDLIQKASLYVDQLILGLFFSAASVAYLTAPKDLITRAQGLTGAAGQALFPRFSSMDEGEEMQNLYITSIWVLTIFSIVIFIPLAIVIPSFLAKWLSPEFAQNSSAFARLFSIGIALNGGVTAYFALLKGTGRIRWLTKIISTLTVLSGIATATLVYNFGLIGSGVRVLSFSWVGIVLCLVVGKKVFPSFPTFRVMFETALIPVFLSAIVFYIGNVFVGNSKIDSWVEIILTYSVLAGIMVILQFAINWLVFQKRGKGVQVLINLYVKITDSKIFKT